MYHALSELEQNLREHGYHQPMLVNHNSGGMAQLNSTDALQTIHSGPVSGIAASEHLAEQAGLGNVVATDMGGTSFDIGTRPGRWGQALRLQAGHRPLAGQRADGPPRDARAPAVARSRSYDRMYQSVAVGPQSAGSDPGPACYDRGGMRPTVTDADLLLGYLDPAQLCRRPDSAQSRRGPRSRSTRSSATTSTWSRSRSRS